MEGQASTSAALPPDMVIGPDGKPCRSCTAFRSFAGMHKKAPRVAKDSQTSAPTAGGSSSAEETNPSAMAGAAAAVGAAAVASSSNAIEIPRLPADCPPDVERLGRHTWTFLHTTVSYFAPQPSQHQKASMLGLLHALPTLYPCGSCAGHLQTYMKTNPPDRAIEQGREALELWLCKVHNEVNERLGKDRFDCSTVPQRWREGWPDGRCD
ncbi:hypothetical protein JCM10908_001849 [Rhodotorula pacifica]|uniref:flavin-linked sulfhydryl oxidase n=1 Tax=Rhodotorula pacifica TaxID=1495444 RepID=UPI003180EE5A